MGWPQFLAWAATQGFKNIKLLRQAYNSFKKFPGKDVILKKAKNLLDDVIKKTSTPKIADKVRQGMKKTEVAPKIVKPKIQTTRGLGDLWPRQLEKILKTGKYKKVPTPSGLKPPGLKKSNVIPFPKKPPGKADGGRIDKALPKRSRDI
jgi:hypothetical protein